ncbi:hypothetical protein PsalN5692_00417 [Piscirickettsia salmonis]|uniref:acyl-CoA dehydrogenase family protein n=1 Tax=Piscirickettsia salmonis TaxID=1238 RepID=UPI0012B83B16|nr:acyl-CoA dehydrogenase family protein [Piscirickettsia salmonis]QGP49001.1 hypothetical protein PsalN5692_00417 [Piscirickettsia salmonis]
MLLEQLDTFLTSRVDPYANQLDIDSMILKSRFSELGEKKLLAIKITSEFNGIAADRALNHDYFSRLARSSYALAFLTAQHESCANLLQKGNNQELKADLLPQMVQGKFRAGVGIYHLRSHTRRPVIMAKKVIGGYRVSGRLDWVSGFDIFDYIALGFIIDIDNSQENREVVGLVPFKAQQYLSGEINIGPKQEVTAISSTNTVAIEFNDWFIHDKDIMIDQPGRAIEQRSILSITHATMLMGIFQAALNIIGNSKSILKQNAVVLSQFNQLNNQCLLLRNQLIHTNTQEEVQKTRAQIHKYTRDCIYLAAALSGGRSVLADHPVQRLNRELLQATIAGVNSLFIHNLCADIN